MGARADMQGPRRRITAAIQRHAGIAASYRNRMPPRSSGRQLGLFDNPVRAFSLEELAEAVRELERRRPGRPWTRSPAPCSPNWP